MYSLGAIHSLVLCVATPSQWKLLQYSEQSVWFEKMIMQRAKPSTGLCQNRPCKRTYRSHTARSSASREECSYRSAGPSDPAPSYREIDSQPLNRIVMALFRSVACQSRSVTSSCLVGKMLGFGSSPLLGMPEFLRVRIFKSYDQLRIRHKTTHNSQRTSHPYSCSHKL